jgi:hypothetical protein
MKLNVSIVERFLVSDSPAGEQGLAYRFSLDRSSTVRTSGNNRLSPQTLNGARITDTALKNHPLG